MELIHPIQPMPTAATSVPRRTRPKPIPADAARADPAAPGRDDDSSKRRIFEAARKEFAEKGLAGARTDEITALARSNKRMLYYYYNSKEELYLAVLEDAYIDMRLREADLHLSELDPVEAITRLVEFKFDYCEQNPWFIGLLSGENLLGAQHLRRSKRLEEVHSSLVKTMAKMLAKGARSGVFRTGVDPLELYVSITGLSHFFFSNSATLSTAFRKDLSSPSAKRRRRKHVVDVILGYLRPE
jgi:AcrR family transcriptional regulator